MIVKVSNDLRIAILGIPSKSPFAPIPGSPQKLIEDLGHLKPLAPGWLEEMLEDGDVIVIDRQDYEELEPEILEHVTILKP